jgi:hypothetical protein
MLKSTAAGSTGNRQIATQQLYSRRNEGPAHASQHEETNQFCHEHDHIDQCFFELLFIFRYDKRFESNRDAGFAAEGGSFVKSANPGQADCEPV